MCIRTLPSHPCLCSPAIDQAASPLSRAPQARASVSQVPLGAIPNYGGRTRYIGKAGLPMWSVLWLQPGGLAASRPGLFCAAHTEQSVPQAAVALLSHARAHAPPRTAVLPPPRPPCRSEGTNASHHRWGVDRVPTPREIVEHLDQYVVGQVRGLI